MHVGRAGAALVVVLAAVTACGPGAGSSPSTAPHIPPPLDACTPTSTPWQSLNLSGIDAAAVGAGPTVVFANDSGNSVCAWVPLATALVHAGYRIGMFTYTNPSAVADADNLQVLLKVADATAAGHEFALVGASIGGRLVIEAAAQHPSGLAGIVSLSGEASLPTGKDIVPDARQVTLPALYVGATSDGYTQGATQQDALHAAMHGSPNELLQRPGTAHGTELLAGSDGAVVVPRLTAFLHQLLR